MPGVGDVVVELVAAGFGVADQIEPVAAPAFSKSGRGQQLVDDSFVGIGPFVRQECGDGCGGRGQPHRVEIDPPNPGPLVGLSCRGLTGSLHLGQYEPVDRSPWPAGLVDRGRSDTLQRLKGEALRTTFKSAAPVGASRSGAGVAVAGQGLHLDPFYEDSHCLFRQLPVRRHLIPVGSYLRALISSLSAGFPATMAGPVSPPFSRASRESSRSSPFCFSAP